MSAKYDQSGKIFSHVISKTPIKVVLQTRTAQIEGEIYKKHDERLLDAINEGLQYIAVTNAIIKGQNAESENVIKASFLIVNRETVEWLIPLEEHS
jgi:hypothetical protein